MRAEPVHSFTRGSDPYSKLDIGVGSLMHKKKMYNDLKKQGVAFWLYYGKNLKDNNTSLKDREHHMVEHIHQIKEFIDKLVTIGAPIKSIEVSGEDRMKVSKWNIRLGDRTVLKCLTEEDAKTVINTLNDLAIEDWQRFSYEEDIDSLSRSIRITENTNRILDNLVENRKKYRNI